jgi:tRNA threonylcarbamoyl adenosine modification protein YjeE
MDEAAILTQTQSPEYILFGPQDTKEAGGLLALALEAGGSLIGPLAILLYGPLGSGKTTFAQGFGEALGVPVGDITSPSFSLANTHSGRVPFAHLDLYRLDEEGGALAEFEGAGLAEYLDGLALVEWPERLGEGYFPEGSPMVSLRGTKLPENPGSKPVPARVLSFRGRLPEAFFKSLRRRFPTPQDLGA